MKGLQIFSALLLALTATFAVTLGVVCLMYYVNLDASPRVRDEWPAVATVTALFWVLTAFAALAWWTQRRRVAWLWPAQLFSAAGFAVAVAVLIRVLGG